MYKNNWLSHNLKKRTAHNKIPFDVEFNFYPFKVESFEVETKKLCQEIYDMYGKNLYLAFSGGSDSEFILKNFIELGIPITPVIVSCPYNQEDIKAGLSYCKKHDLKPEILNYGEEFLDLALEKIYNNGFFSLIGSTPLFVYDEVSRVGGKVINGQGEPAPITIKNKETKFGSAIILYEFEYYLDCYAKDEQPASFFVHKQEVFYTYIKEIDRTLTVEEAKCKLYKIENRKKTYWSDEIYVIMEKILKKQHPLVYNKQFNLDKLMNNMDSYLIN
jgi:hypothetical protein